MSRYEEQLKAQVKIGKNVFIAPNATLMGNISLAENVSIWYGAILRADMDSIEIGCRTNVQDGGIMLARSFKTTNSRRREYDWPWRYSSWLHYRE